MAKSKDVRIFKKSWQKNKRGANGVPYYYSLPIIYYNINILFCQVVFPIGENKKSIFFLLYNKFAGKSTCAMREPRLCRTVLTAGRIFSLRLIFKEIAVEKVKNSANLFTLPTPMSVCLKVIKKLE